ncbi:restriction endonuclease subunit S [Nodularia sphaerocarpa]|uniref:restriction endonuclease subunit S n=1 Tax=Nodularia sphaerocarpa TaxID=137816 RepID=UPI001EFB41CB|nr:restriction endonuclease subunit S [Nodularia sphaerocarpa]MDB9375059.1 restriction endonuclease subunit S [Nodularia sphaerocarpa CS-585]MDB9376969.1 restriction endonuclease subunit S [Nodularia sphaerocarpa CS-585A2]ULP73329.1 Type-1 restriction enzyme EcoKI specificity protein [Nodularia sphaerocarpa UHCC 0038]
MKRYPQYKDSGVEWLGDIPEHWEVKRLKFVVKNVIQQKDFKTELETYIALEYIESWTGKLKEPDEEVIFESTVKCFSPNDILFCKLRPYLAKVVLAEKHGVCVGELLVIRFNENILLPKFIFYDFLSKRFIELVNSSTYGAKMPRASWTFISNIGFHIPPLSEQKKIACFLDSKLEEIDKFISNKQRLIELLKEQKTAIINRAVTKGLNPHAPMKPSGIEWLGDIPAHWEVKKLKYIAQIVLGKMLQGDSSGNDYLKPYLRSANIQWDKADVSDIKQMWLTKNEMNSYLVKSKDILVSEGGEVGRACIWNNEIEECYIQNSVHKITCSQKSSAFYIYYQFYIIGHKGYFESIVNRVSIGHLTREKLINIKFIIPPLSEQNNIADFINQESAKINQAITTIEKEIELIKEYRTTLISEAVTGKIDVRET